MPEVDEDEEDWGGDEGETPLSPVQLGLDEWWRSAAADADASADLSAASADASMVQKQAWERQQQKDEEDEDKQQRAHSRATRRLYAQKQIQWQL